ncbi:GAF domain-containing protein [uncultured Methanolobus sp.]|uniref:sensor histidine kinase n=1 Tax=uncultured Methanolobus sp. TaxID=218300 RepID=UPI0029C96C9A|nr:GAF domain-containing protein [uncultured Methanolobus sp.]
MLPIDTRRIENARDNKIIKRKREIQKALSQIASIFAYPDDINIAINEALENMGNICNASRIHLFFINKKEASTNDAYEWCASGVKPQKEMLQNLPNEVFSWSYSKLQKGELLQVENVSDLPAEASAEKLLFEKLGIKSILAIPIFIDDTLEGVLSLENNNETDEWEKNDIDSLFTVSNLITMALKSERMKKEIKLTKFSLDHSDTPTFWLNENGHIFNVNKAACASLGYSYDEMQGMRIFDIDYNEEELFAKKKLNEIKSKGSMNFESIYRKKNGALFPVEVSVDHLNYNGEECYFCYAKDISERKNIEDTLHLNESRLETLLELNNKKNLTVNEIVDFALEEGVKLTRSQVGYVAFLEEDGTTLAIDSWSKGIDKLCTIPDRPRAYLLKNTGLWGDVVRQKKPILINDYSQPSPFKRGYPEGHVKLERNLNIPIYDGKDIVGVAGVANKDTDYDQTDIKQLRLLMEGMWEIIQRIKAEEKLRDYTTELMELNEELRHLNEEMKYVDEIKDNFLANVSHELKTPLTAIMGYSGLLIEEYFGELNNKQKDTLRTIVKNSDHMKRLIDSLLYLSSLQIKEFNYEINPLQLKTVIEKAASIISLEKNQREKKIIMDLPESLPLIEADKEYVTELFIHILDNAFKFTATDGIIRISSKPEEDYAHITISDDGVGINRDKLTRIFNVFYQGDGSKTRRYNGTGIGLHMCRKIIEDHGGEIKVESEENKGTVVHLIFPICPENKKNVLQT